MPWVGCPLAPQGTPLLSFLAGSIRQSRVILWQNAGRPDLCLFHAYPYVGDEVKEKIIKLVSLLAPSHRKTKLVVVPFGKIQEIIGMYSYPEYRTVLFRLYMLKTAELLAEKLHAGALITGDGLGQVSSQTLANLSAINGLLKLFVLRPLIGLNKIEIID